MFFRSFARAELLRKLQHWGIRYVIGACGNPWIECQGWSGRLWDIARKAGQVRFWREVFYHRRARVTASLVVAHAEPAPEPWYLVTNLERGKAALEAYRRRAWIEEHFRDARSQMALEGLRMARANGIERLLILMPIVMAVAILIALWWHGRHPAQGPHLSSHKRGRTLSLFRLGLELARGYALPPRLAGLRLRFAPEAL